MEHFFQKPNILILMQSFVTTAPMGPGKSSEFDLPLCIAQVHAWHCWDIFSQILAQSPAQILPGKCETTPAGLNWESKAQQFHSTVGTMLKSKYNT